MSDNFEMFTRKAINSIDCAIEHASEMGHTYVGTEHLLLGFLKEDENIASAVLKKHGITFKSLYEQIIIVIGKGEETSLGYENITPALKRVINSAAEIASSMNTVLIGTEHLLMAIINEHGCGALRFFKRDEISTVNMYNDCMKAYNGNMPENTFKYKKIDYSKIPTLSKYGKNLTEQASKNNTDPLIGREKEIERIIQILARRTKNNPCLTGEAGVGKTAIVEGIAQMIARGEVPDELKSKTIFALDLTSMVAGAKYRGDFEERIKSCIEEVISNESIILFIDEIHSIVGAGAAEGAIDAANILKPQLARSMIQIIGATTLEEYKKYIEKDSALERRFQPVFIDEPSEEATIRILEGIKEQYERYHNVNINDDVIKSAVSLSVRYINDRFLPDKAIDILDEAASRAKIKYSKKIKNPMSKTFNISENNLTLETIQKNFKKNLDSNITITTEDTAAVVSLWTGIPINRITKKEETRLINLEKELKKKVIGQDKAVNALSQAIRRSRAGLREQNKPICSFLFVGSTGVGKTELSKSAAEIIFDSDKNLIKVDMSEYMEKHSVSKIIGAPPGYAGYDEKGGLTEIIRRKPYSVVVFDEIEKAHPDVLNLLLQILDEGTLTDSTGRKINFKNTLIIMTSNIASEIASDNYILGFGNSNDKDKEIKIKSELKKHLKSELINRIDEIIIFNSLNSDDYKKIAEKLLNELNERAKNIGISISCSPDIINSLIDKNETKKFGARYIKRQITSKIENLISQKIIEGEIKKGDSIEILHENNDFKIACPLKKDY